MDKTYKLFFKQLLLLTNSSGIIGIKKTSGRTWSGAESKQTSLWLFRMLCMIYGLKTNCPLTQGLGFPPSFLLDTLPSAVSFQIRRRAVLRPSIAPALTACPNAGSVTETKTVQMELMRACWPAAVSVLSFYSSPFCHFVFYLYFIPHCISS